LEEIIIIVHLLVGEEGWLEGGREGGRERGREGKREGREGGTVEYQTPFNSFLF
jgi:hypothetical protein